MTMFNNKDTMIDRSKAAEYLGVKPLTLTQWAHKKKHLPYYKVGGLVKYKFSDLQIFIKQNKQEVIDDVINNSRLIQSKIEVRNNE